MEIQKLLEEKLINVEDISRFKYLFLDKRLMMDMLLYISQHYKVEWKSFQEAFTELSSNQSKLYGVTLVFVENFSEGLYLG